MKWFLAFGVFALSCGDDGSPQPPTDPAVLSQTLMDLAGFGNKHVGTPAGTMAGEYVRGRMEAMGLADVHFESFQFPRQDITSATVNVTVDGAPSAPGADGFDGTGAGHADADVIYVGYATA